MCDSHQLASKYIRYSEPSIVTWAGAGCTGRQGYGEASGTYQLNPAIQGIWIPPHVDADLLDAGGQPFAGDRAGGKASGGYYETPGGFSQVSITTRKPWMDHLTDCCTGKVSNGATPETCGAYWGKSDNQGLCDSIMEDHCDKAENTEDPKCSCYGVPIEPDDDLEVRLLKAQPKCWSDTCAKRGYLPSNMIGSQCPNVQICKQDIQIPGSHNIMDDNQYIQDCSQTIAIDKTAPTGQDLTEEDRKANTSSGGGSGGGSKYIDTKDPEESTWLKDNMMVILVALVILAYIMTSGGSPAYPPQYSETYYDPRYAQPQETPQVPFEFSQ
jgi:hypothetical protein